MRRFKKSRKKLMVYYLLAIMLFILLLIPAIDWMDNAWKVGYLLFGLGVLCCFVLVYLNDRKYAVILTDEIITVRRKWLKKVNNYEHQQVMNWESIKAIRYYRCSLWRGIEVSNGFYNIKIPIYMIENREELLDIILDKTKVNKMIHVDDKVREIQRSQY